MNYIADLHIHSCYSRATSKQSTLHGLAAWARVKGIQVLGTGDFTHPGWFAHLSETLEAAEPGFFRIRDEASLPDSEFLPLDLAAGQGEVRFVLTAEISSIYKRNGRVRKVHNILFAPDLQSVRRINRRLAAIGNIESDGRPILGLDARDLLTIVLDEAPQGFLVPAHIWTPWFSLFGSKSGFNTIEECFGDLSSEIFALETGLSSDPEMNRLISALDRFTLISNSDCHSPGKLGREANLFATGFDYFSMKEAIRQPMDAEGHQRFQGTIEFYPEEGKYHCDGHRKCGVCLEPEETLKAKGVCPNCGRPVTIGVLHRVLELADRDRPLFAPQAPTVHSLIPLPEILGELLDVGPASKKVMRAYGELIQRFGSEFHLLLHAEVSDIRSQGSELLAEAIERVRQNRVIRQAGYDGEFGVIRVFNNEDRHRLAGQLNLFGSMVRQGKGDRPRRTRRIRKETASPRDGEQGSAANPEQDRAIASTARHILVQAGPGTGKTHTLVGRVKRVANAQVGPCTVITFTNRAAAEVEGRLADALGRDHPVMVATFHGFCLHWLRQLRPGLKVAGPEMRQVVLRRLHPGRSRSELRQLSKDISTFLLTGQLSVNHADIRDYFETLDGRGHVDIEAVIPCMVQALRQDASRCASITSQTGNLFIDEFQDLNRNQYELVRLLSQACPLFVIGDPDQAIYGFRGADPEWFFRFIEEMEAEVHTLIRNYRSAAAIIVGAQAVIANNPQAGRKGMRAEAAMQGEIYCCPQADAQAEAAFVSAEIEQLVGGTSHRVIDHLTTTSFDRVGFGDIGILYRTGAQAEALAEVLAKQGIPSRSVDLEPFYLRGDCRRLFLWLQLLGGRGDNACLLELLGHEQGIGAVTVGSVEQVLDEGMAISELLDLARNQVQGPARQRIDQFARLHGHLQEAAEERGVEAVLQTLSAHYALDSRQGELSRFFALSRAAGTDVRQWADFLHRFSDATLYEPGIEAVTLCTLHAAKGLEFRAVFLVGLEEELCPLAPRQEMDPDQLRQHVEEERRLFYVGMTRAIERLYLCWAGQRTVWGQQVARQPSRFIKEIPGDLEGLHHLTAKQGRRRPKRCRQLKLF